MKKLLITGFEPFGGEEINPSWDAVSALADSIGEWELTRLRIPVVFGEAARLTIEKAEEISADAIIAVGQAGGRVAITPELVAINLRYAPIPDNSGYQPKDEPVISGGERAYFSTLPVRKMVEDINASGVNAALSYSAGAYVCNDLLYTLLSHFEGGKTRVCFIHVPYSSEQGKEPCMDLSEIIKGLTVAIGSID